ncbi:oligo-1,6-glucosidase [Pseudolysinimonas kribbensis]|uniref:alpha-glucosidase n=1 Tax=Pseudolysinimonas kribbensis TaxID=433641 RepID=UPI0031D15FE1
MTDTLAGREPAAGLPPIDPWWHSAVIYQIYPRSFADANGDGIGDLRGILQHLDHLEDLGVDAIWLSPIYPSPGDDNGYDISDYEAIDPVLGTLEDFDDLVAALHARGMRLVMDLVVNHTSDEHPWFVESASGPDSPKRDWYWWRPARPGTLAGTSGAEPTNWESFFSGPVWQLDPASGEYYLHLFSAKQPDLNWENPDVRQAVYRMMRWWLDRGIDGFRMDVINLISKDPSLPDGAVPPDGTLGDGFPHYAAGPRIHEFLQEMHREVFAGRDAADLLTVGEMPGATVEQARLFTDPERRELDMVFQFDHVGLDHGPGGKFDVQPLDLVELKASFDRWQRGLADVGWNSLYWNNHDQPRAVSRFGDDGAFRVASATALAAVLHLQRGTPYVYQGEELGMTNARLRTSDDLRDIESLRHYELAVASGQDSERVMDSIRRIGRDNARTPMPWSDEENGGFGSHHPWIDIHPDFAEVNARQQRQDPSSVFAFYRRLIRLRHEERVVAAGRFELLAPGHPQVFAYRRDLDDRRLVVIANLSGEVVAIAGIADVQMSVSAAPFLFGNVGRPADARLDALQAWEARIFLG